MPSKRYREALKRVDPKKSSPLTEAVLTRLTDAVFRKTANRGSQPERDSHWSNGIALNGPRNRGAEIGNKGSALITMGLTPFRALNILSTLLGRALTCLILFPLLCIAEDKNTPLTLETYQGGTYRIALSESARKDEESEKRLLAVLKAIETQRLATQSLKEAMGDAFVDDELRLPHEYYKMQNATECRLYLELIKQSAGTDSELTSILLLAIVAMEWESGSNADKPIRDALEKLATRFPKTWQAAVAPLIEAGLIARGGDKDRIERKRKALELLKRHLPTDNIVVDAAQAQYKAFSNFYWLKPLEPIRASYLLSIAYTEYSLATSADGVKCLASSEATFRRVVSEYPSSEQAKRAKQMLETQIAEMKKLVGGQ